MSFIVVVESGSYGVGTKLFKAGKWESDDPNVLESIKRANLDHVYVIGGDDVEPESEPDPEPEPEADAGADPETGDDDGGSSDDDDSPGEETPGSVQLGPADESLEAGPMTKDLAPQADYPCRSDDCDKVFATSRGRVMHERSKHGMGG